nr:transposase [Pseudomonas syringae]
MLGACSSQVRRSTKSAAQGQNRAADVALNLINKLYGIERALKEGSDEQRYEARQQNSVPVLTQLHTWMEKTLPHVTAQNALGKAISYLASKTAYRC